MNLIDAINSGRPFRRATWMPDSFVVLRAGLDFVWVSGSCAGDRKDFCNADLLADDWEAQPEPCFQAPVPAVLAATALEMQRARKKFPSNKHLLAALGEEFGEVCNAALEGLTRDAFRTECIQVACVALRLAEEGDPDFAMTLPAAMEVAR